MKGSLVLFGTVSTFLKTSLGAVVFSWATVGNPGNPTDPGNQAFPSFFGAVGDVYRISKHEVTNMQYAEFLNGVADTDPNNLYNANMGTDSTNGGILRTGSPGSFNYVVKPGFGDKPVTYVSWFDAARFVNWLHNGQALGSTETGAYDMTLASPVRLAGATHFLPSENEWYKAAFYEPGSAAANGDDYWLYPTRSDSLPTAEAPPGGSNSANFIDPPAYVPSGVTDVGTYAGTTSFYGAFDMTGNLWEWNEELDPFPGFPDTGRLRGGSWIDTDSTLKSSENRLFLSSIFEGPEFGFRIASVPEPATSLLCFASAAVGFGMRRRRS